MNAVYFYRSRALCIYQYLYRSPTLPPPYRPRPTHPPLQQRRQLEIYFEPCKSIALDNVINESNDDPHAYLFSTRYMRVEH